MARRGPTLLVGAALLALALVTGLSLAWTASSERGFIELDRVLMYLGVFAAVATLQGRAAAPRWVVGMGAGIAGVAGLAFVGRCFQSLGLSQSVHTLIPSADGRLAYPMGYWNGVGIFAALGVPLLAATATRARTRLGRGLALAPVPVLASVIYLTSSRGAVFVVLVGTLALVILAARRTALLVALAVAAAGSALAVASLGPRHALVEHPGTTAAVGEGHSAALIVALLCAATGVLYALVSNPRLRELRLSRAAGTALAAAALIAALVAVVASDPAKRLDSFKTPPTGSTHTPRGFIEQHLLSGSGSGRWQFWGAAVTEFRSRPLNGHGAGSYEAWWTRHGPIAYFVRDAHSLWLQTLGELGLLGFLPLAFGFAASLAIGLGRLRARPPDDRIAIAALAATLVAWMAGAAVDWIWQLTAVGAIGVICAALLCGRACAIAPDLERPERGRRRLELPAVIGAALVAIAISIAAALPWLVEREIQSSQAAVRSGNLVQAQRRALDARALQPWAASPYLQLALTREVGGNLRGALSAIRAATRRDPSDWRLWLAYARIATQAGKIRQATKAIGRVRELNPRSPLFAGAGTG